MQVLDCLEFWCQSTRSALESAGVTSQFARSPEGRLNPSCFLNLRRNELEGDLVACENGEAELTVMEADGFINRTHIDDVRDPGNLEATLSRLVAAVSLPLPGLESQVT